MQKTQLCFSPRKKEAYFDEEITAQPKNKPTKNEDFEDELDGYSVRHLYESPRLSDGKTRFLEEDGAVSLDGIFRELDEECCNRTGKKKLPKGIGKKSCFI